MLCQIGNLFHRAKIVVNYFRSGSKVLWALCKIRDGQDRFLHKSMHSVGCIQCTFLTQPQQIWGQASVPTVLEYGTRLYSYLIFMKQGNFKGSKVTKFWDALFKSKVLVKLELMHWRRPFYCHKSFENVSI